MEQSSKSVPSTGEGQTSTDATPEAPGTTGDQLLETLSPSGQDKPVQDVPSTQPPGEDEGAAGPSSSYLMDEVFRVNRLLQIENMDWAHQLKQAVRGFQVSLLLGVGTTPFFILC